MIEKLVKHHLDSELEEGLIDLCQTYHRTCHHPLLMEQLMEQLIKEQHHLELACRHLLLIPSPF
tara:strand:+ start:205 stop:396 length:192 start_codon:yes stop_codon:yes gene_type:complete